MTIHISTAGNRKIQELSLPICKECGGSPGISAFVIEKTVHGIIY
jgi:hypothetical protein